jgi:hypothetical protein
METRKFLGLALLVLSTLAGCGEYAVFNLSVALVGQGTVKGDPKGIDCPGTCQTTYVEGVDVDLTATPALGWRFGAWGGSCSGTAPTTSVSMLFHKTCDVAFCETATAQVAIGLGVTGQGEVRTNLETLSCKGACAACLPQGSQVTLTALPFEGYRFLGWTGDCSGTEPTLTLTLDADLSCATSFGE